MNLNLHRLVPAECTPDRVEPLILANRNAALLGVAATATAALQALFARLTAADLVRLVAGQPDAEQSLGTLGAAAREVLSALVLERADTGAKLREDSQLRHRHDGAAVTLLMEAEAAMKHSNAAAATSESETLEFRMSLISAGLSTAEIAQIVGRRVEEGQPEAEGHRAAAAASQARADLLTAFIRDPLRRIESLDDQLATEVRERMAVPDMGASQFASLKSALTRETLKKCGAPSTADPATVDATA